MPIIAMLPRDAQAELLVMGILVLIGGLTALVPGQLQWARRLGFVAGVLVFFCGWLLLPWPRRSFFGLVEIVGAILMVIPLGLLTFEMARRSEEQKARPSKSQGHWD